MSFNFMAAVTICSDFLEPPKIKSDTVSTVSPSISHEVMGPDALVQLDNTVPTTASISVFTLY